MNSNIGITATATGDAPCSIGGFSSIPRWMPQMWVIMPHTPPRTQKFTIGLPRTRNASDQPRRSPQTLIAHPGVDLTRRNPPRQVSAGSTSMCLPRNLLTQPENPVSCSAKAGTYQQERTHSNAYGRSSHCDAHASKNAICSCTHSSAYKRAGDRA